VKRQKQLKLAYEQLYGSEAKMKMMEFLEIKKKFMLGLSNS